MMTARPPFWHHFRVICTVVNDSDRAAVAECFEEAKAEMIDPAVGYIRGAVDTFVIRRLRDLTDQKLKVRGIVVHDLTIQNLGHIPSPPLGEEMTHDLGDLDVDVIEPAGEGAGAASGSGSNSE